MASFGISRREPGMARAEARSPVWAAADRPLWRRVAAESSSGLQADVHALSPSDASNLAARLELQSLWPAEHRPKRRVMGTTPNLAAVVLLGYSGPTEDPARCGPGRNDGPASRVDGDSRFTHPAARRGDDVQGCAPWLGQRRSATDLARVARWEADGRAYSFSAERAQVADDCRRPAHPRAHLQRVYHGAAPTGSDARLTYRPTHAAAVGSVGPARSRPDGARTIESQRLGARRLARGVVRGRDVVEGFGGMSAERSSDFALASMLGESRRRAPPGSGVLMPSRPKRCSAKRRPQS